MKTIREILKKYLEENGYEGFYLTRKLHFENCQCEISDDFPCDLEGIGLCKPGIKTYPDGELGWTIQPKKIPENISSSDSI